MKNVKTELVSYEQDIIKRIQELKGEIEVDATKLDISRIINSNKDLPKLENNKEEKRKDSINSKNSNKSNNSSKSKDSKHSNKSNNSSKSKHSNKSNHSSKSKDSRQSKTSNKSIKSKGSKSSNKSNDSKHSNKSGNVIEDNKSDDNTSEGRLNSKKSSRRDSEANESQNYEADEYINQENENNEDELKFLEEREKFDEDRINKIIENNEIIEEIKKYYLEYKNQNEIGMNMTSFSKFIRSIILLMFKLKYEEFTNDFKIIVKLVYDLLFNDPSSITIDEKMKEYILKNKLIEDPINKYFFHGITKIENYMLSLYLYCAMNIHIYVFGPPGVGKTAGAECLARIRKKIENLDGNYKKYAFNSSTNPSDIYGAETLVDGEVKLIDGPLTESALKGQSFIADEMNLSSNSTMMSLIPIFNTIHNRPIYFPGLQTPIKINPNFWFGAFQNYEGTSGRNATPHELALKLIRLDYPKVQKEDIKNICLNIRNSIYKIKDLPNSNISDDEILELADFMIKLNQKREDGNLSSAEAWSIRNLENLINRMAEQEKCKTNISYKYIQYENCELYMNVLFYVLSYIDFESINESFDQILDLIKDCFQLTPAKEKELRETYFSNPEISYDNSTKFYYLRKNKSIIKFQNSKIGNNISFLNKISSLLNTLFNCLLCADTEPILLIGPSGYKTYLVQLLIENVKIITLNEESSIDALLGSTGFFTKEEVKSFYLSLICDVCIKNKKLLYLQDLKNKNLKIDEIENYIKNFFTKDNSNCGRRIVFKNMINRTYIKLKNVLESQDDGNDNILNNIKLEFKPGLFTTAILGGDSLNLRNFDKIPTTTLERFNELFTGMKTLTLNEDKFNTITTAKNKLICDTVDFIRFFATSLTKNFSEAVLSRWTVINTKEYEFDELEEVLKICSSEKDLNTVTQNDIKYLIEVARFFKDTSNKTVSIKLLINAIELLHDMNTNLGDIKEELKEQLYYINRQFIYYVTLKSIIEQNRDDPNLSEIEVNNKLYQYLFNNRERKIQIDSEKGKSPFYFVNKNNLNGIKSLITNAFIPCVKKELPKTNPAFTNKFVEMLNIIHLGLSLNAPIVLEGLIGQGKQTAIKYLSEILGLKLLNIQLASSNKEEDLLGKIIVDKDKETNSTVIKINETDLMKILRNKAVDKYLIVFNNIQNASDAVKEKIANICDRHQKNVLLPDGNTINKPPLNIICVINTEINSDIRNKLPSPLLYSTIYHKVGEMTEEDIKNTTMAIFEKYFGKDSEKEAEEFFIKFRKVNTILNDNKSRQLLTFNDINNYAKLNAATKYSFDKNISIIDNMIFYYKVQEEENMMKIKKELNINGFDFVPLFEYNPCHTELYIKIKKNQSNPLILKVINKDRIDISRIKKKLNTLTNHQKQCILFLACAWLTKSKVIIRGDTASGKTHCAILFSEMLGADLLTYQMNQDLTPSIFTGQSILEEDLNEKEIELIKKYLSDINSIKIKENNITQILEDTELWKPLTFNKFFELIDKIVNESKLSEEKKKLLLETKAKINCIISPQGRFKETESQTSSGLLNGSWFLYDDIQFATPDLLSIMTPLCSDKPSLNLFNAKDSPKYTSEIEEISMNNAKLINSNFNLIMTFNPKYCKSSQELDPILENKCLSFNLPPNDNDYESSAQMFFGGLINSNIGNEVSYQLGGKLSNVHMLSKMKSLENKEFFEGDSIFTSRTISRALKYINSKIVERTSEGKEINLPNIIKVIVEKLYARPYIEKGFIHEGQKSNQLVFRENIVNNFSKDIDEYKKTCSDNNFDENNKLLRQLRDIQIAVTKSKAKEFKFIEFVSNSLNIKLEAISFIIKHIYSTLMFIYCSSNKLSSEHLNDYHQISVIYKLLKNIMKYGGDIEGQYNEYKLSDPKLLTIEQLKWPILRINLLNNLLNETAILPQIIKREFSNDSAEEMDDILQNKISINILGLIAEMVEKKDINSFINIIKYLNDNLN